MWRDARRLSDLGHALCGNLAPQLPCANRRNRRVNTASQIGRRTKQRLELVGRKLFEAFWAVALDHAALLHHATCGRQAQCCNLRGD